jgi:excinuclease ABC subunit C
MQRPDLQPLLDSLPAKPGVYQFFDADGEIVYVGKAVNLRSRVRSYFPKSAKYDHRSQRIAEKADDIEWIVTQSDLEALLLEMNLIKRHRPRYNVLLKDDKRYPYIKITWGDAFPTVHSTRKVVQDGARYFGPYASAVAMRETINTLRRVFPFLDCSRTITGKDERACLYYDIDMCLGPCIGAATADEYREMIDGFCRFLKGETGPLLDELRSEMAAHAERLEFEKAARVRDRVQAIEQVIERQRIIAPTLVDQDVVAIARDDGSAVAQVFFVRSGKLIGREYFQLEGTEDRPDDEILSSFIKQFYDESSLVPGEIVVSENVAESEVIERWLADKRGTRVRIAVPQRGRKRELVDVAVENAAETLRALRVAHVSETQSEEAQGAIEELGEVLSLPRLPKRIECYDISNLQGTHTVGSMVVFEDAAPQKADYRHFRIKDAGGVGGGGDDYAAMEEMLKRRLRRLVRFREEGASVGETPGAFEKTPDLVLVDGGKGQLGVAVRVLQSLALDDLQIAALAKREEALFRPGEPEPILLPKDSRALYLVQRARDEAHRFAIAYNRKLRRRRGLRSTLDEIPGIGAKRRRALLTKFGSLDRIRVATVDELAAVPPMTRRAAEQVKAYL